MNAALKPVAMMSFGVVVISAGLLGLLSFILLAVAVGTEYWYIIDADRVINSSWHFASSHSGLWRTYEGECVCVLIYNQLQ